MIFKCKMCGGDLDIEEKSSVGTCQYCGTQQTLPKLDDDKRKNLYERANHHRRQHEFDKAAAIYESILNEDKTDAEAYWSLVLCKYGVDYVEDPATKKRIPTCNRTLYGSVLADEDYKQALSHADAGQRNLYEEEARIIDGIQKGILEISNKEDPFDVFICYKETDDQGKRTLDSKLAQDLHHELTEAGFKVFFARITLEDKIGSAYEPYIFAALQSAKVMVVLGTRSEHFNAVWVKNEWSRYLALIKGGAKKTLIPAYRDMDPYTIPEELSHLQAQDMGKLGFMQDLVRGIKKVVGSEPVRAAAAPAAQAPVAGANTAALLQRAFIELEDGNWQKADGLLEQVLNAEPQNVKAYVGKAMASLRIGREAELAECDSPLTANGSFQKALRFADDAYRAVLQGYVKAVEERLETRRKQEIFDGAVQMAGNLTSAKRDSASIAAVAAECRRVAEIFKSISGFSNADEWVREMEGRAAHGDKLAADEAARELRLRISTKRARTAVRLGFLAIVLLFVAQFSPIGPAIERFAAEKKQEAARAAKVKKLAAEEKKIAAQFEAAERERAAQEPKPATKKQETAKKSAAEEQDQASQRAAKEKELAAKRAEEEKKAEAKRVEEQKKAEAKRAEEQKKQEAAARLRAEKRAEAEALAQAGKFAEAMPLFNESGGYSFGTYAWRILDVQGDKALIITEGIIARKPFNDTQSNVDWERSTLREYLNGEFLDSFSAAERKRIETTKVSNPKNGTFGGKTTRDKIFLLSVEEANKYFKDDADRTAADAEGKSGGWWLRTQGTSNNRGDFADQYVFAAVANDVGKELNERGSFTHLAGGVRPALWIDLKP